MTKASDFIREIDTELADFLDEELEYYSYIPECFDDKSYIPTKDELKFYDEKQLEYLMVSANIDEADALFDGGAVYERLNERNVTIQKMIHEELKRRNEI